MEYQFARMVVLLIIFCFAGLAAGCAGMGTAANTVEPDYRALVASPDRTEADLKTDERRNPAMLLAFAGVKPSMRVLDLGAGAGYSTELLARALSAPPDECMARTRRCSSTSSSKAASMNA